MNITPEYLQERLSSLEARLGQLQQQYNQHQQLLNQTQANINATVGAISDTKEIMAYVKKQEGEDDLMEVKPAEA